MLKKMASKLHTIFPVSVKVRLTAHTSYNTQIAHTIAIIEISVPIILYSDLVISWFGDQTIQFPTR